jgi:hypothetical protein
MADRGGFEHVSFRETALRANWFLGLVARVEGRRR